jgi:hypothetical protein
MSQAHPDNAYTVRLVLAYGVDVVGVNCPLFLESIMKIAFAVLCAVSFICIYFLGALGYEYSYGSGYGLHPGLVGGAICVLAVNLGTMWGVIREEDVDGER